jgi:hypothetical protein
MNLGRGATLLGLGVLLSSVLSTSLAGQTVRNHLYDKFQIGAYVSDVIIGSTVRVDGSHGVGTDVDAEDNLGLDSHMLEPRFDFRWRPGRRHELEVGYQFARRTGDKTLTGDLDYGDTSFVAGLTVRSRFDTDYAFFNYRFAFMAREKTQIGVGLGLGALLFNTGIDALAEGGGMIDSVSYGRASNLIGPTASVGIYGRFLAGKAWYLEGDLRGVKLAIDRYDASVFEGGVGARYFVSSRVGIDGGYGISSITVDIAPKANGERSGSGRIEYSLQHIRLGLVYAL